MLHSLYDFKATYAKTLSFKTNEYFLLHQTNTKHKNWWEVINEKGEMGYIPSNYVESVTVNPSFFLQFLNTCLENLVNVEDTNSVRDKNEIILRLKELKKQIRDLPEIAKKSVGPDNDEMPPLLFKNSDGNLETIKTVSTSSSYSSNLSELRKANSTNVEITSQSNIVCLKGNLSNDSNSDLIKEQKKIPNHISGNTSSSAITPQLVYDLIESVRINTQLSYEMSRIALVTVIQGLHELLPASVFPYLSTILSHSQTSIVDDVQIDQTHDASRLKIIFNELTSCKEDSQQRSWMLHEDESVIKDYIIELISILVCTYFLFYQIFHLAFLLNSYLFLF